MVTKKLLSALLLALPLAVSAQSTDAAYPIGHWWNEPPGMSETGINVEVEINRGPEKPTSGTNTNECGWIVVTDNKTNKTLLEVALFYNGKGLASNGMTSGVYFFTAKTKDGKSSQLGIRKLKGLEGLKFESVTGPLQNHAFLKEMIGQGAGPNGHYADTTPMAETEQELLQVLREADPAAAIYGFGNFKQYITAHAKLNPAKPKYAKPKSTSAINIRKSCSATAAKIGELQPGSTLQVVDEYNGWCQVKVADKQFGWVSLSVVTLTNTPAGTASASAVGAGSQEPVCPLVGFWSGILSGGWGDSAISIKADMKAGNDAMNPSVVCNGSISMSDEDFINERHYFLQFNRTIAPGTYEFTAQLKVGKQMKSGKMQIKKSGNKIIMTGLDAWAKQQPFHNKSLEVSNL